MNGGKENFPSFDLVFFFYLFSIYVEIPPPFPLMPFIFPYGLFSPFYSSAIKKFLVSFSKSVLSLVLLLLLRFLFQGNFFPFRLIARCNVIDRSLRSFLSSIWKRPLRFDLLILASKFPSVLRLYQKSTAQRKEFRLVQCGCGFFV